MFVFIMYVDRMLFIQHTVVEKVYCNVCEPKLNFESAYIKHNKILRAVN